MENWISFFYENGGLVFAALGVATATICGGIGSTIGVGMTSEAAAGLTAEQPEKFGQALILELLSSTQGLYGFVISFMIFGQMSGTISLDRGMYLFIASLPIALTAIVAGRWQGRARKKRDHLCSDDGNVLYLRFRYFLLASFKLRGGERCLILRD